MRAIWFVGPSFDLCFFHLPVWVCWLIVFQLPAETLALEVPTWVWVVVVMAIDVGHVWSSLYRTYWDPVGRRNHRRLLALAPPLCFAAGLLLALISQPLFWRVLAYVAAFHFVKQQIGITALCRVAHQRALKAEGYNLPAALIRRLRSLDHRAVYTGTLCPLLWWHWHLPRKISWFIEGDFISPAFFAGILADFPVLETLGYGLFFALWLGTPLLWLGVHLWARRRFGMPLPIGKMLWVGATIYNWYLGLVHFDSDLVFTLTNVVAHGVPYYGLTLLYHFRKSRAEKPRISPLALPLFGGIFLAPLLLFAWLEEYLWDVMLYRDHPGFFIGPSAWETGLAGGVFWPAFWVALLFVPQAVHYIADGFIWKMNPHNPDLKRYLFFSPDH